MEEQNGNGEAVDIASIVRQVVEEYARREQVAQEPEYRAELGQERKKREDLELRLNELVEENKRSRHMAEQAERHSTIRAELQRLGVGKIELAFRAVRDDIVRSENGRLVAKGEDGEMELREYLSSFVNTNPELLPARIPGGSGVTGSQKAPAGPGGGAVDLDRIRPGMSREEMERVRQEIVRVASQTFRGL